jgi:hypothetical protein
MPPQLQLEQVEICFAAFMKWSLRLLLLLCGLALFVPGKATAGEVAPPTPANVIAAGNPFDVPQYEFASETAYLLGFIGNPNSYEIGAQFFTGRLRWGVNANDNSIFRGYNQVYFTGMIEPIFRGIENHYFGISAGFRHVFVRPGWRVQPYASGGVGLGWINDHWKLNIGVLYQHLSNGGQTDPNPSLNLIGPQVGATFSF